MEQRKKQEGLGASADADRATDAPHGAAKASPPSGSVSTGAVGFGGRAYSASGNVLHVAPLRVSHSDGRTGYSLGFPMAQIDTEVVGEDVPKALAEYLSCPKRAAAPDLFEALDEMQRLASDIPAMARNERFGALRMKALAALSKARGA